LGFIVQGSIPRVWGYFGTILLRNLEIQGKYTLKTVQLAMLQL